ncbi:hypothetical protein AMAG_12629 [Allomyces macrogynus ATCC 38327]|uniref:Protein HGH1 homolog n=1 Tax=Allomyces macrogynus (strain ATCC 38327) TaxID=578462 RepID=A0A0L0SZH8_ALLM3|nr:hypothetical protein AMAG_12629 [Allomyces macrogynus ATCC 38327]|eukprot:KNE67912.1 hypothetical protein AMAG_12629 [Allomyces macrogynus ATCC 38327]
MTTDLAKQLDELIEFLGHEQAQLRQVAAEYILGLSAGDAGDLLKDAESGRLPRLLAALDKALADEPEIAHLSIKTFITLSKDHAVLVHLNNPEFLLKILTLILTPSSVLASLACMLLSNLTHNAEIARTLVRLAPVTAIKAPPAVVMPEHQIPPADRPRVRFLRASVEMVLAQPTAMDQLVEVFVRGVGATTDKNAKPQRWYNKDADFHFLASVFANVSQHSEGRAFFLTPIVQRYPEEPAKKPANPEPKKAKTEPKPKGGKPNNKKNKGKNSKPSASTPAPAPTALEGTSTSTTTAVLSEADPTTALSKILCFTDYPDLIRRGGVTSTVKNVTFDLRAHPDFLDAKHPNYLLHSLLVPLAPAEIADALLESDQIVDLDTIPDWLLSLPTDHYVERDFGLKSALLEGVLVLASTRAGRTALRAAGAYLVIREYHKEEEHVPCRLVAERIVDMLMRDEGETEDLQHLLESVGLNMPDKELEAVVTGKLGDMDIEVEYTGDKKAERKAAPATTAAVPAAAAPVSAPAQAAMDEDEESDDDLAIEEIC